MTSKWWWVSLVVAVAACGDDGSNRLADAPPQIDAAVDAAIDAPPEEPEITVALAGSGSGTITSDPAGITCGATCASTFPPDTVVTLTAEPAVGSVFVSWGGACSGTTPTCTVTADAAKDVTATFDVATYTVTVTKSGAGTGTISGSGIDCGATCTTTVEHGAAITLTAAPASLSVFAGWGGACSGTSTCTVTVTDDTAITAAFALDDITLSVTRGGNGMGTVTSAPAGINCGGDCEQTYTAGQAVTLTATPATGSTFTGWAGGGCTGTGTCTVTMTAATAVTATFTLNTYALTVTRTGNGTVASTPSGIACGGDCTETYDHGTMVTLTATPAADSSFTGWSGACSGTGACVVSMTAARSVSATFALMTYPLSVTVTGMGNVSSNPVGINCGAACMQSYQHGTNVTLTPAAVTGYTFTGWGGACTGTGACTVAMTQARTVSATFTLNTYPLDVTVTGTGTVTSSPAGITCGADCSESYNHGTNVTLTPAAGTGYTFTSWGGACSGSGACVVPMTQMRTVTATFTQNTYNLGVSISPTGGGTVTGTGISCPGDCTEVLAHGTNVTLTATPSTGYTFSTWSGACSGPTCTVAMTQARNVTANFTLNTYPLDVTIVGSGSVASSPAGIACGADCSESYSHGTNVTLTPTPGAGSSFSSWGGACSGAGACVVPMTQMRAVTATFTQNTYALNVSLGGNGFGRVTASGIDCPGDCAQTFNHGTSVTLTAIATTAPADSLSQFVGWIGGGCSGPSTCTVSMTQIQNVTAVFSLAPNVMFVTSTTSTGNLDGLTGANSRCQALANQAGLVGSGFGQNTRFVAWLSTSTVHARDRLNGASGWVRTDGRPVFNSAADLAANKVFYPPRLDEQKMDVRPDQRVWTATNASGAYDGNGDCSPVGAAIPWVGGGNATTGLASGNGAILTKFGATRGCANSQARLYCLGTDRKASVGAPAQAGRIAFTTKMPWTPSGGLDGADALCRSEAMDAGLDGSYRALLSTTSVSATSRFDLTKATWVRAGDGIAIVPTAADLANGNRLLLDAAPNALADGTRIGSDSDRIWGGSHPGALGTLGATCAEWTSAANKGYAGFAGDTGITQHWFGSEAGPSCDTPRRLVCLQL